MIKKNYKISAVVYISYEKQDGVRTHHNWLFGVQWEKSMPK